MNRINHLRKTLPGVLLSVVLFSVNLSLMGQYNYYYRVYFRDKGTNSTINYSPSDLFSERALARREKVGILVIDFSDLPVSTDYISQITSMGYTLHCTSKWINTALFKTIAEADLSALLSLPYVANVRIVKRPVGKGIHKDKLELSAGADLPPFDRPVTMVNGNKLHTSGFDGKGVLIAVLDGGFTNADQVSSLAGLRLRNGIKATNDIVNHARYVYDYHTHGTAVLSVLAGQMSGTIAGTATGADYILVRTEDVASEFPVEEDFWAAGAEYADSAGADIISSSLGYFNFDDPSLNYKFSDLDGKTAFVTRAADFAASKGILVVNSAGNERDKTWVRIIAPSDGDSVIAVGAVDSNGTISTFSSAGPSADGRVKPDNVTMGVSVPVQTSLSGAGRLNGTSLSCPVLSGMTACLIQAVPGATNAEIIEALHASADRYNSPDSLYGYGIPDMEIALSKLQDKYLFKPENKSFARPNPTKGELEITFREAPGKLTAEIFTSTGKLIYRKDYGDYAGRSLIISALQGREQGLYLIRLTSGSGKLLHKIIKLKN